MDPLFGQNSPRSVGPVDLFQLWLFFLLIFTILKLEYYLRDFISIPCPVNGIESVHLSL